MKIALGTDHRGLAVAQALLTHLRAEGHDVEVLGECTGTSIDYPDVAFRVAHAVAEQKVDRGILICGTGIGMCIAANKVQGIRAAMAQDELSAQLSRTHNDANVLCLSADLIGQTLAKRVADVWTKTAFEGGRHQRRLNKIAAIERGEDPAAVR
ncbi:MAG: ribose 5-phosphate isomerase B [Phycisphaerae bacterium]|jgi:ribose 5-phosphate isomerase B|nr:ribose 5-phosphate isomerase B [Phycisphaerae bacterium]